MTVHFVNKPLPAEPVACGTAAGDSPIKVWAAAKGRAPGEPVSDAGVCVCEKPRAEFASLPMTLELWIRWPGNAFPMQSPVVVAEAACAEWSWRLLFDQAGAMVLHWRDRHRLAVVPGDIVADWLQGGAWYHVAMTITCAGKCRLALTEAGRPLVRWSGESLPIDFPAASPRREASLAIGRRLDDATASALHVGSAAWHRRAMGAGEFAALGAAALPEGITADGNLDYENFGRAVAVADDTMVFSAGQKATSWFAFRLLGAKGRRLRLLHFPRDNMGLAMFISEDGGRSWTHPSGGTWRSFGQTEMVCQHTFTSDEAIVANCPPVTVAMADSWIDRTARRFGGCIHEVGRSREGRALRVVEIGNPDAPMVHLQAGQHSMQERMGYFMIETAMEEAAQNKALMERTRWTAMPLVNVDAYDVTPEDGNMNRFWTKPDGPPTVMALCRWLRQETDRTGGTVMVDWHAGTVWRGHTLVMETALGFGDPYSHAESLHVKREHVFPEFEEYLRAEGLDYGILNGYARNLPMRGRNGYFEEFVLGLRGVSVPMCVELTPVVCQTPDGTEMVTLDNLRADGRRWCRAIGRYVMDRLA